MAIDVIIRPEGRCITIVCDIDAPTISAARIDNNKLLIQVGDDTIGLGVLKDHLHAAAHQCDIAVVVIIQDNIVVSSKEISLSKC